MKTAISYDVHVHFVGSRIIKEHFTYIRPFSSDIVRTVSNQNVSTAVVPNPGLGRQDHPNPIRRLRHMGVGRDELGQRCRPDSTERRIPPPRLCVDVWGGRGRRRGYQRIWHSSRRDLHHYQGDASAIDKHSVCPLTYHQFWPHFGHPDNVALCLDKILKNMGLDHVDLYLAHWPCVWKPISRSALENAQAGPDATPESRGSLFENDKPVVDWEHSTTHMAKQKGRKGSFVPTWQAMQACVKSGKARTVGLSNFSITEIQELLPHEGDVPISCNQIEVHPRLPQNELVGFGRKNGILITCYSPFGGQNAHSTATVRNDANVLKLADKNKMDVGQLLHSWAVQRETVPLGKSATSARIKSNLAVRKLSEEDMKALNDMALPDEKGRTVDFADAWGVPLFKD